MRVIFSVSDSFNSDYVYYYYYYLLFVFFSERSRVVNELPAIFTNS